MRIGIIGGGVGGLTLALALHARGIEAEVVEAAPEIRPLGVGINILPHATKELAALGSLPAQENLGSLYLEGCGEVAADVPEGVRLTREAAEQGDPMAQANLGACCAMGLGVEGVLATARVVAAWPQAAPVLPPIPGWSLAVASLGFCWLALWRGRVRLAGLPMLAGGLAAGLLAQPPDILVTADARLIAFRTAEGVFLQEQPGATPFARAALLRRMGAEEARALPAEGEVAGGALACTGAACRFRPRDGAAEAVLLRSAPVRRGQRFPDPPDPAVVRAACGTAALLVSAEPLRPRCGSGIAIDRFTVWREGAQAVALDGQGARVVSDRAARGDRPWVPPPPLPGRPDPLPMAPRAP